MMESDARHPTRRECFLVCWKVQLSTVRMVMSSSGYSRSFRKWSSADQQAEVYASAKLVMTRSRRRPGQALHATSVLCAQR